MIHSLLNTSTSASQAIADIGQAVTDMKGDNEKDHGLLVSSLNEMIAGQNAHIENLNSLGHAVNAAHASAAQNLTMLAAARDLLDKHMQRAGKKLDQIIGAPNNG